ncbi:hypothetical protein TWF696_007462 [Orbilia brochopaga]|uniref:Uncharacterized protein n=1 Tax=Orbilia brochopaga TaxID=3140254 RepID=A0AAV9UMJ0_9PEZI
MNNNGGRNVALVHGRSLPKARWILPLDGNCFFTPAGMRSLVKTLSTSGEGTHASRYAVLPMVRLFDNNDIFSQNSNHNSSEAIEIHENREPTATGIRDPRIFDDESGPIEALEEPQIGFRYDATETFAESMRYGRRSKLELLWRLGAIPYSEGLDKKTLPWEREDGYLLTEETWGSIPGADHEGGNKLVATHELPTGSEVANPERGPLAFTNAGWVYRLFSGDKSQEEHTQQSRSKRNVNRMLAIISFLESLDERTVHGSREGEKLPNGLGNGCRHAHTRNEERARSFQALASAVFTDDALFQNDAPQGLLSTNLSGFAKDVHSVVTSSDFLIFSVCWVLCCAIYLYVLRPKYNRRKLAGP